MNDQQFKCDVCGKYDDSVPVMPLEFKSSKGRDFRLVYDLGTFYSDPCGFSVCNECLRKAIAKAHQVESEDDLKKGVE